MTNDITILQLTNNIETIKVNLNYFFLYKN